MSGAARGEKVKHPVFVVRGRVDVTRPQAEHVSLRTAPKVSVEALRRLYEHYTELVPHVQCCLNSKASRYMKDILKELGKYVSELDSRVSSHFRKLLSEVEYLRVTVKEYDDHFGPGRLTPSALSDKLFALEEENAALKEKLRAATEAAAAAKKGAKTQIDELMVKARSGTAARLQRQKQQQRRSGSKAVSPQRAAQKGGAAVAASASVARDAPTRLAAPQRQPTVVCCAAPAPAEPAASAAVLAQGLGGLGGLLPAAYGAGAAEPVPGDVYQGYRNEVAAEARDEVAQPSEVLCGAEQRQQQQQRPSALKASLPRNAFSWDIYEDEGEPAGEGDAQGEVPDTCEEGEPFVVVPGHTAVRYIPATQMRPAIKVHRDTLPLRTLHDDINWRRAKSKTTLSDVAFADKVLATSLYS